ncbi:MAG: YiiX/YebB-like N1pC/P60 family cysteine hydrolase [Gammaproteobacteria bacterium]|nr:YiiX/YebB-like N1pC/P60 family cysteine hydrolase [Gammaproteobacteria bacterium]
MRDLLRWLYKKATDWLTKDGPPSPTPLCDFNRLGFELRSGDVILVEGRSRVSEVIKQITQSPWSHSALYIGRLYDVSDPDLREVIGYHYDGDPEDQLVIEALMGKGTIISPLSRYHEDHLRICRPTGLSPADAESVIGYAAKHLGWDYDVRQILDLARFFFPWSFLPRRWRSSLFEHNAGKPTRTVCSTLLAEAFMAVDFPILPFIDRADDGSVRFFKRNPRLATPRDFDYSPYFSIIKYPFLGLNDIGLYHRLPWTDDDIYNDERHAFKPPPVATAPPADTPSAEALAETADIATVDDEPTTAGNRRHHAFAFLKRKG